MCLIFTYARLSVNILATEYSQTLFMVTNNNIIHTHIHAGCMGSTSSTMVNIESDPVSSGLSGELTRSLYHYEINYA